MSEVNRDYVIFPGAEFITSEEFSKAVTVTDVVIKKNSQGSYAPKIYFQPHNLDRRSLPQDEFLAYLDTVEAHQIWRNS